MDMISSGVEIFNPITSGAILSGQKIVGLAQEVAPMAYNLNEGATEVLKEVGIEFSQNYIYNLIHSFFKFLH